MPGLHLFRPEPVRPPSAESVTFRCTTAPRTTMLRLRCAMATGDSSMRAGQLAVLLVTVASSCRASPLSLSPHGSLTATSGAVWLHPGPTSFCSGGKCFTSDPSAEPSKQLHRANATVSSTGCDRLGCFNSTTISWRAPDGSVFETSRRSYSTQMYVLGQKWVTGCVNCSGGVQDRDDVQSAFPTFVHSPAM